MSTRKAEGGWNERDERGEEDWCFVCKDGGELILCDYMQCRKVYHSKCLDKDKFFFETGEPWTCDRHYCFKCHEPPTYFCYCCTASVCETCIRDAEFMSVREKQGFCSCCLELIHYVEGKEEFESDEEMRCENDRNSEEWLFKEYWDIVKQEEGLTMQDVFSAEALLKKDSAVSWVHNVDKISQIVKVSSESDWESDPVTKMNELKEVSSDSDWESDRMVKRNERKKVSYDSDWESGSVVKMKALKFVGWGSRPLVEFLESVGEDAKIQIPLFGVFDIISRYIQEKNLYDPKMKKVVLCDERLQSIFGRKTVHKNKMYHLLQSHYVENLDPSEDDTDPDENSNRHANQSRASSRDPKRQRTLSIGKEILEEGKSVWKTKDSCFASVISENIRLVYLRRTLVEELLKESNHFGDKVIGSFVNVKLDKRKCNYQLLPVTGLKQASNSCEVLLEVSTLPESIPTSMLSDSEFYERDLEDLQEKIKSGLIERPIVVELEEKAKSLHYLITKDWIERELIRLKYRIDRSNEKGWRALMIEDMQKRDLLMKPSEQERLLQQVPKVIAEQIEVEVASVDDIQFY